jgi:hypothetical protein
VPDTREPIKVVADVIKAELGLADEQIMLAYQPYTIPENRGLFVSLREIGPSKVIANINTPATNEPGVTEIQETTIRHLIQIDILSFNSEARTRKEEVVMALNSVKAQQEMELNLMQFGRVTSDLVDASSLEETQFVNRFTMTIAVTALHRKTKTITYFDQFTNPPEVTVND